ncbi:hypothetical protein Lcho_2246 [Leptothrix cholodnii SP-6]|uniref:Phage virion morphogenesis protein n=1 Tax=Leptothrix cholodnii (strain ATCC 51168 / LMG 8142 / SP-6) TaxID=395495 RepID=B1Y3I4_LEPCP|nr:phage virion morphogenesis protein [Leptothrix cholodnii]ACB34512.1 hypothetical protein Lcho_2246 [Leptothrix cholodnii SP-6]
MSTERLISITVSGAELQAALDAAVQALAQPRELLDSVGAVLQANINIRFDTKTDPSGQRWAPISALTPQFYALTHNSKGQPRKPTKEGWASLRAGEQDATMPGTLLIRTGQLRNSLTRNSGDDFVDIGFNRATPGGKWQVAMLHEFGTQTQGGKQKMPRRGLLTADPQTGRLGGEDTADVLAEVDRFLTTLF